VLLAERGVKTAFVEKGSPQQNAFVERFNGMMRDEVLNRRQTKVPLASTRRSPSTTHVTRPSLHR
jgi:transposase InsO family protein